MLCPNCKLVEVEQEDPTGKPTWCLPCEKAWVENYNHHLRAHLRSLDEET